MLQAMAGPHESDPWSIGLPIPDYLAAARPEGDLRGTRILYCAAPPTATWEVGSLHDDGSPDNAAPCPDDDFG